MTRPPPLPPLFPYTTLFRSQQSGTSRRYEVQMSPFPTRLVIDTYHGRAVVQKSDSRSLIRSEEHTSELQSLTNLVCRLLLEKKKKNINKKHIHNTIKY